MVATRAHFERPVLDPQNTRGDDRLRAVVRLAVLDHAEAPSTLGFPEYANNYGYPY
jgi:hypothetical protein